MAMTHRPGPHRAGASRPARATRAARLLTGVPLAIAVLATACLDSDREDAVEETEEFSEATEARTVAEALQASLLAPDLNDRELADDVDVLRNAVNDLPDDPEVRGIVDADEDGRDDDGQLEVHVEDEAACVSIDNADDEVEVTDDTC